MLYAGGRRAGRTAPPVLVDAVDLTNWKLTTPLPLGGSVPVEILQPDLADYSSAYFMPTSTALIFWCPVTGAVQAGSSFPRCELREMAGGPPAITKAAWGYTTYPTYSQLVGTLIVDQVPSTVKVIIGQIHGTTSVKALLFLVYENLEGGRMRAAYRENPSDADTVSTTIKTGIGAPPTPSFTYKIRLTNAGVLTVQYNVEAAVTLLNPVGTGWDTDGDYFKAGSYCQDNSGPDSEGARVIFSSLVMTHV